MAKCNQLTSLPFKVLRRKFCIHSQSASVTLLLYVMLRGPSEDADLSREMEPSAARIPRTNYFHHRVGRNNADSWYPVTRRVQLAL